MSFKKELGQYRAKTEQSRINKETLNKQKSERKREIYEAEQRQKEINEREAAIRRLNLSKSKIFPVASQIAEAMGGEVKTEIYPGSEEIENNDFGHPYDRRREVSHTIKWDNNSLVLTIDEAENVLVKGASSDLIALDPSKRRFERKLENTILRLIKNDKCKTPITNSPSRDYCGPN